MNSVKSSQNIKGEQPLPQTQEMQIQERRINYLGVIIRANNIKGNPIKVAAI